MDSSGVGMIIGRYKTMHCPRRAASLPADFVRRWIDWLFHLAGLHRIIAIDKDGRAGNA
ncbi:MAG: hypothetical protein ACLUHE_07725 [Christensenellales bacterium]